MSSTSAPGAYFPSRRAGMRGDFLAEAASRWYKPCMAKDAYLSPSEADAARQRRLEARQLQAIEGNPLSAALARANAVSINKLIDELATVALANFDARLRFEARATRGNPTRALALLDKLDQSES